MDWWSEAEMRKTERGWEHSFSLSYHIISLPWRQFFISYEAITRCKHLFLDERKENSHSTLELILLLDSGELPHLTDNTFFFFWGVEISHPLRFWRGPCVLWCMLGLVLHSQMTKLLPVCRVSAHHWEKQWVLCAIPEWIWPPRLSKSCTQLCESRNTVASMICRDGSVRCAPPLASGADANGNIYPVHPVHISPVSTVPRMPSLDVVAWLPTYCRTLEDSITASAGAASCEVDFKLRVCFNDD